MYYDYLLIYDIHKYLYEYTYYVYPYMMLYLLLFPYYDLNLSYGICRYVGYGKL